MLEKIKEIESRFTILEKKLSDPNLMADQKQYKQISKEYRDVEKIINSGNEYKDVLDKIKEDKEVLESETDEELCELAKQELHDLVEKQKSLEQTLKVLLIPKDENDSRNTIVEIRAGTGGDEAGLFSADLYRMYAKYAERCGWNIENMSSSPTGIGGFKEIIFLVNGDNVYSKLKFESGVHRVQRVPETESSGRVHTSAATVAIMPEVEDVEVDIQQDELKIDVYRSSGPGGQSVNTTDSAVRVTHIPTDLVVTCQDEKSQHKNKTKALKILRARLYDKMQKEQQDSLAHSRKLQIGSGDRSEKIRTYNFPQNRISDHRVNYTSYNLEHVMEGHIDELIDILLLNYQNMQLQNAG